MSDKTVGQKARVKPSATIAVINRVPGVVESLGLPEGVTFVKPADAQLVFLFVRTRAELEARMPLAVAALGLVAAIWVFFRKGSRDAGLDMNRDTVWAVAEKLDMRPLGILAIDDTWSAFRLRRARQGREGLFHGRRRRSLKCQVVSSGEHEPSPPVLPFGSGLRHTSRRHRIRMR